MGILEHIREQVRIDNDEFSMTPCSFCGGELEERLVQHEYRWEGELVVFEEVPALVCRQCGGKYFDAKVVKAMEKAVLERPKPKRLLRVPLFSYSEVVAA